jgi:hypothetical protein
MNVKTYPPGLYICKKTYIKQGDYKQVQNLYETPTCKKGKIYQVTVHKKTDPFMPGSRFYKYGIKKIRTHEKNITVAFLRPAQFEEHFQRFC